MIKEIIKDKDLIWDTDKYDVILVGTSIYCMLTAGFQSKMRYKYDFIEPSNDETPYGDLRKLGKRLTLDKQTPIISLLYICHYPRGKKVYIDYDALEQCLKTANAEFAGKNVATTIIGSSRFDGNGDKEKCLQLIKEFTPDLNLTIYDYEQLSHREEIRKYTSKTFALKFKDKKLYKEMLEKEDEFLKSQYLK